MKKIFIISVLLFAAAASIGLPSEKTAAQIDQACVDKYHERQFKCIDNIKICAADCDKAFSNDFDAYARCQEPCNSRRNDCDAAANALYAECLGLESPGLGLPEVEVEPVPTSKPLLDTTPPSVVVPAPESKTPTTIIPSDADKKTQEKPTDKSSIPGSKPVSDDSDDQTVWVDSADIVRFKLSVQEEAKQIIEMKKCPGLPLPSENPCMAEKLDFMTIGARESPLLVSFLDKFPSSPGKQENAKLITLGQNENMEITMFSSNTFPPTDPDKLDKIRNQLLEMVEAGVTLPSWTTGVLGHGRAESRRDKSGSFYNVWVKSVDNSSEFPRQISSSIVGGVDGSKFSLAMLGKDAPPGGFITVKTAAEISSPSVIVTGDKPAQVVTPDDTTIGIAPRSGVQILEFNTDPKRAPSPSLNDWYEVLYGAVHVNKSEDGKAVEVRTPITTTKSKHTKFAVFYSPEELYAATIVYEGEVEVTDVLSGRTATIVPTDNGKPRVFVVPLAEMTESVAKRGNMMWIALVVLLLLVSAGYFAYRKKDASIKI